MYRARIHDRDWQRPSWFFSPDGFQWMATDDLPPTVDQLQDLHESFDRCRRNGRVLDRSWLAQHGASIELVQLGL